MVHIYAPVTSINRIGPDIYVMGLHAPEIASGILPGQFVNLRVHDGYQPLLRRPFSIYRVTGETIELIFNLVGTGTTILHSKKVGDEIDMIGPLGRPFHTDDKFETAIVMGGGMGVAPLPILTQALKRNRKIVTYLGARSKEFLVTSYLENLCIATDDGSAGFHGTVVELLRSNLTEKSLPSSKIFACGPNPMLKAVSKLADEFGIPCELSLESVMACGIGICQGCPVENANSEKKYSLICKDGPVFNSKAIIVS
ncbi:MAG: dihydroorotate dehydrogenase electron transfer subunit [Bacteroidota bacterium]